MKIFLITIFSVGFLNAFSQIVDVIKEEHNFSDVRVDGKVLQYYKGSPFTGTLGAFYDNGNNRSKISFKNGKYDGPMIFYYENGNYKSIENWKNGILHGEKKVYYPNGVINYSGQYHEGTSFGIWKIFYENGMIMSEGMKSSNCSDFMNYTGKKLYYFENGQPKSIAYYDDNCKQTGVWLDYDEFGNIILKRVFMDGKLNGVTERYNEFVIIQEYYQNGVLIQSKTIPR